ncbi:MAG TPA: hypothetical protein PLB10_16375, partial [Thiolinea sp.]|nr:hypothetical protein [Thiolinea sp.]
YAIPAINSLKQRVLQEAQFAVDPAHCCAAGCFDRSWCRGRDDGYPLDLSGFVSRMVSCQYPLLGNVEKDYP